MLSFPSAVTVSAGLSRSFRSVSDYFPVPGSFPKKRRSVNGKGISTCPTTSGGDPVTLSPLFPEGGVSVGGPDRDERGRSETARLSKRSSPGGNGATVVHCPPGLDIELGAFADWIVCCDNLGNTRARARHAEVHNRLGELRQRDGFGRYIYQRGNGTVCGFAMRPPFCLTKVRMR